MNWYTRFKCLLVIMFRPIFLCLLVGLVAANDYAWKSNVQYQYDVEGRTLTGLHELADQYAGVLMQASLTLQRRAEGILIGRVSKAQYAEVNALLPDGWDTEIPINKLKYQSMPLSQKPFEVRMKNGTVHELVVEKEISNWEANILKSIVTQIQVDVQGENTIKSRYNRHPQQHQNDGMFKVMEDSVSGKCEVLYDINPLPEYILQSRPELLPLPHLKSDGEIIEVVKTRNYSNCDERVSYHYGLHEMKDMKPSSSMLGEFLTRSSVSRVILTGNLQRHTIQSSVTTNKIVLKPTPNSNKNGIVVSQLNITLTKIQSGEREPQQLSHPKKLGNLVYKFNSPFSSTNEVREGSKNSEENNRSFEGSSSSSSSSSSSEEDYTHKRHPRSLDLTDNLRQASSSSSSSSSDSSASEEQHQNWKQDKPSMTSPPETPMLPYYIGYMGQAIKQSGKLNIVEAVQKLAQQISYDLRNPSEMPKEDTLAKFVILSKLIRTMNVKEIQEVGHELYNLKQKEVLPFTDAWKVYRDAVAQAGTGPALLTIQEWILTMKIHGQEAATLLATLAHSTRQPTDEYMRTFYVLATKPEIKKQAILNDTAILSFTELVRKVYVDTEESYAHYPVHTFGKFYKENQQAVTKEYIPYLAQQLKRAVSDADSHKIQVYIRALGNVAHRQILEVFEPYLEGQKDVSTFQRLFMVVCMDQLVKQEPRIARSVLYKIYQNQGEETNIRVAAVYQLMKTVPPTSMLQRMAEATNEDSDNDVNSAVKSAIEYAAELEDPIYAELAENAKSAVPLLTSETYGIQYSKLFLKNFVVDEWNMIYKQSVAYLSSEDSIIPEGIMYSSRSNMGGLKRQYMNVIAMVSNVQDAFQVLEEQTEDDKQEQYDSAQHDSKYAGERIAKLLKLQDDESEQVEGNILLGMGEVKRFFTFDNHTIERLPEYLKDISGKLREGMSFNYTKFLNPYEMTLSFPTAMGLPFVYTLETPTLLRVNAHLKAKTQPEIVTKNTIRTPETLNMTGEIEVIFAAKKQAKLGFVTPFNQKHYIAGYDKKAQMYLPVEFEADFDFENDQIRVKVEPIDEDENEQIIHFSSWPYTAKRDILQLKPVSQLPSAEVIHIREPKHFKQSYGEKTTGMVFNAEYFGCHKFLDAQWLYQQYQRHEGLSVLMAPFMEDSLLHYNFSITYDGERSIADSVIVNMGWNETFISGKQSGKSDRFEEIFQRKIFEDDYNKRQEHFIEKVASGINSVEASVYDFSIQFEGEKQYSSYNATLAVARSPVDKKSRVLFYFNKDGKQEKEYEVCLLANNEIPNTNGLDYEYALKFDPTATYNWELKYGQKCQKGSKVELKGKLMKSHERVQYLQERPMAKVCHEEMKEGNHQLEGCRNMTTRANFYDRYNFEINYEDASPYVRNITNKMFNAARYLGYYYMDEDNMQGHGKQHKIQLEGRIAPDFKSANVSVHTEKTKTHFNKIRINEFVRPIVAVHPIFDVIDRVNGFAQETYFRPTCVVDNNAANTFDNTTYQIDLGKTWHVMMMYLNNYDVEEQRHNHHDKADKSRFPSEDDYDYVVLVRDADKDHKEFKIVINDEKNYWEIDMVPRSGSKAQGEVRVNRKIVEFDDKHSYNIEEDLVHIYALPNGEIKVEVNDDFYLIYDGQRAKLTTTSDDIRGDVYGLCGNFDGEDNTDFMTPQNCILENEREFVASWAIIDETAQGSAKQLQKKAKESTCYKQEVKLTNVVSKYDIYGAIATKKSRTFHNSPKTCSKQQTQYVEDKHTDEICFSVHPVSVCRSPCKSAKQVLKNVDVHCIKNNNVAQMWKKQIEKGSSPDFSRKPVTKKVQIKVAQECTL